MVSVTVVLVTVLLVMEPCVKFGTTGTAIAVLTLARADTTTLRTSIRFIHQSNIVISLTN